MYHVRIENPKSGRMCAARVWDIHPSGLFREIGKAAFQSAKELSWHLLEEGTIDMAAEMDGDCAANNFSLSIFENALDWRIGFAILGILRLYQKRNPGYAPKRLRIAVNRAGDLFYRLGAYKNPWRAVN